MGYLALDLARGEVSPSLGAAAMLGVPRWRMRLEVFRQFVVPADQARLDEALSLLADGQDVKPLTLGLRSLDGSVRQINFAVDRHEAHDADGRLVPAQAPQHVTVVLVGREPDEPLLGAVGEHEADRFALAAVSAELDKAIAKASQQKEDVARAEAAHALTRQELRREKAARVELARELERTSHSDALTGLPTRGRFFEEGEKELARARRHGRALSLIVIDLDGFRRINDRYGHGVGDRALCHATTILRATPKRPTDFLARLSGQELAVLLPDTGDLGALTLAERLRAALERTPFVVRDDVAIITGSFGLAELAPEDATLDALLARADQALGLAKARGRNRCEVAARVEPTPSRRILAAAAHVAP